MKPVLRFVAAALAASLTLTACPAALAQAGPTGFSTTGQPTDYDVLGKAYVVDGYRGAQWGMTPTQARATIPKAFPDAIIGKDVIDPVTRTTIFVVEIPHLSPGPGPTAISYIFGATTGRLIHINIDWQAADPNSSDRLAMTVAGSRVVADFISYYWKLLSVARGVPAGPNSLVLFAGAGEAGGNVEVRLQGVAYIVQTPKGPVESPPPKGQVLLHIGFAQSDGQPDVYTIKPGEF